MRARSLSSCLRIVAALAILVLALVGCSNDDSDPNDTTVARARESTGLSEITLGSDTTAVAETTGAGDSDTTTTPETTVAGSASPPTSSVDPRLVMGVPRSAGEGLIQAWSADGSHLVVLAVDDKLSKEGCEGLPEPVLFLQNLDGAPASRTPAIAGDFARNGTILRGPDGRVVLIEACEGYLGDLYVGTAAADGSIGDLRVVDTGDASIAELSGQSALTPDGAALLLTGRTTNDDGTEQAEQVTVDLATGAVAKIASGARGGHRVAATSDGRYVVTDGMAVDVVRADGTVDRSYEAVDFDMSADGTTLALVAPGRLWILAVGADPGEPIALPKSGPSSPTFAPDGRAVGLVGEGTADDAAEGGDGWVAVVRGGQPHLVEDGATFGRLTWNASSNAIAYNRFPPDFSTEEIRIAEALRLPG